MHLRFQFCLLLPAFLFILAPTARAGTSVTQGVPQDGFPSWQERTVWVLVNRDRADPTSAFTADCDGNCADASCVTAPLPPLAYNFDLSRSGRLQPQLLAENNVTLMHPSPCQLTPTVGQTYPDTCDGGDDCACQTPVQCASPPNTSTCGCNEDTTDKTKFTQPFDRIRMFAPGGITYEENLAAGQTDPMQVEKSWLGEPCTCCTAATGAGASSCAGVDCLDGTTNGHRANLMSTSVNSIGVGAIRAPVADCYSGVGTSFYWGQDFGYFADAVVQKLVAGSHFPQGGTDVTFYANWYDPTDGAPATATVVINGKAQPMTVDRGSDGNATYAFAATLGAKSCNSYSFAFVDASGTPITLPITGSYLAGDGCTADYASGGGGCATGLGDGWFGVLTLAAAALRPRRARPDAEKLTKRQ